MTAIGCDIGGTSAKLGLVDRRGRVLRRSTVPTGAEMPAADLVRAIAVAVAQLREGVGATLPAGLGVAAPGMRREDGEGVVNVTNLPHIDGFPLRAEIEAAAGLPAVLDNDANAAALGEARFGAGAGVSRVLVLTVGTGIGAGMVVDGRVHRIATGGLGDPGHVIVQQGGPLCGCGGHGCVEAIASVPAIVRLADQRAGRRHAGIGDVAARARAGCPGAAEALDRAGEYLGMALATLTHLLAPQVILLGGGGMDAAEELLMNPVRNGLYRHIQPYLEERLRIARARLGNDAGIVGAAALIEGDSGT